MECLYKEDVDRIFTLEEPFEEMGSEAIEVPALKDEEFAQITVLGLCVSFPNEAREFTFKSSIRYMTTHGWWPIPRLLIKVPRFRFVTISSVW
ncbi:hypothetical protein Tco_0729840 [Tanacetum coccineum]|uniref:Uncharacterized protein n=1 Tax=Tanacetum coccineum TaxID=301880 RepID=A0ABQ4YQ24_9ASTR